MNNYSDIISVNKTIDGKFVNLAAPNDLNATVNVHLMPGKIATFQENLEQAFNSTV